MLRSAQRPRNFSSVFSWSASSDKTILLCPYWASVTNKIADDWPIEKLSYIGKKEREKKPMGSTVPPIAGRKWHKARREFTISYWSAEWLRITSDSCGDLTVRQFFSSFNSVADKNSSFGGKSRRLATADRLSRSSIWYASYALIFIK